MIMTADKARKIAARQRMAETGEPYSVARHAVQGEHAAPGGPPEGVAGDVGADEVRPPEQAGQARRLAEQARIQAERAAETADRAEEAADLAEEVADEAEDLDLDPEDGPPRWRHHPPRPPSPPRPPRPPRGPYHGPRGQDEWSQPGPDPAERRQDRVDRFIQRLSVARDQADRLISAAERIFTPPRSESARSESARPAPARPEPARPE